MWDMAVRHGFGAVRVNDDDASTHIVPREESAEQTIVSLSDDGGTSLLFRDDEDYENSTPRPSTSRVWSDAVDVFAPANSSHAPINLVLSNPDYFPEAPDSDGCPSLIDESPSDESKEADMTLRRDAQQPDFGEPFISLTAEESAAMALLVAPVHSKLLRLKEAMPYRMSPYHQKMKTMSYGQVLKTRLAAIARLGLGQKLPDGARGRMELKLCRYITTEYWPLPVTPTTHLDIHCIYKNALFRQLPTEQLQQEQAKHREWVKEALETQRPAISFGAAASRFAAAKQACADVVDAAIAEDMEKRRKQEEQDREYAVTLERENNQGGLGLDGLFCSPTLHSRNQDAKTAAGQLLKGVGQGADTEQAASTGLQLPFESDEAYARWLQMQENGAHDDMPGLINRYEDPYIATAREEEEQISKDHAIALQLFNPPVLSLPRTRSQASKDRLEYAGVQEVGDSEDERMEKLIDVETPPRVPLSRYSLPPPITIPPRDLTFRDMREVGIDEDDEHTALMQNSPAAPYGGFDNDNSFAFPQKSPTAGYERQKRHR